MNNDHEAFRGSIVDPFHYEPPPVDRMSLGRLAANCFIFLGGVVAIVALVVAWFTVPS